MPKDRFLVLQVEGTCVGGNLDVTIQSSYCIAALITKQKMGPIFEWHNKKVSLPHFRSFLAEHSHTLVEYEGALDKDLFEIIHVDSDMQQIVRLI